MKNLFTRGTIGVICLLAITVLVSSFSITPPAQEYYEIRVYKFSSPAQEGQLDNYLRDAYLPALKRAGVKRTGVFKPITNDTAAVKRIFVLIPLRSLNEGLAVAEKVGRDKQYQEKGKEYLQAVHTTPPYQRMEKILLQAFQDMPQHKTSGLTNARQERIYELRSYEGHTENINKNKIEMFNQGGEIRLFDRLGFNAIFYGEVLYGSAMPNLMYMTSFADMNSRNEHWKTFGQDAEWKKISSMPNYQNNVSRIDIYLMKAADYSDF